MKIRIKANTIRLRLTQPEVERFAREGYVGSTLHFNPQHQLHYALVRDEGATTVQAHYRDHEILVKVPMGIAEEWTETDRVGFQNAATSLSTGRADDPLFILVEKDFQCLHQRPHEDEGDQFPHPLENQHKL